MHYMITSKKTSWLKHTCELHNNNSPDANVYSHDSML